MQYHTTVLCAALCVQINIPGVARSPADGQSGCIHALATVDNTGVNTGMQLSLHFYLVTSFPSGLYSEMELLDHTW